MNGTGMITGVFFERGRNVLRSVAGALLGTAAFRVPLRLALIDGVAIRQ
jgi:hypothetical protein